MPARSTRPRRPLLHWLTAVAGVVLAAGLAATFWLSSTAGGLPPLPDNPPEWLTGAPRPVRYLYRWAAAHHETLAYIPCYCGCGDPVAGGHQNNADCYYRIDGGRLAYERHALG